MKKNVIINGLIAGAITAGFLMISVGTSSGSMDMEYGMLLGYASMILAFSLIFVAVKNVRDHHNEGIISFGKAFTIGFYISLIASTMYVVAWMIDYHFFIPDFMDKYIAATIKAAEEKGMSEEELSTQLANMEYYKEMYKNPLFVFLFTYTEILPVGLLVSLIAAAVLKRNLKRKSVEQVS